MTLRINEQGSPNIFYFIKIWQVPISIHLFKKALPVCHCSKKSVYSESNIKVVKNHGMILLQRHLRAIWFNFFILKMSKLSHSDVS